MDVPPDVAAAFEARARLFKRAANISIFAVSGIMFVVLIANDVLAGYHTNSSRQPSAFGWLCVLPVLVVVPLLRHVILGGPAKALAARVTHQAGFDPNFQRGLTRLLKTAPFSKHRFTLFGNKSHPQFEHPVKGRRVIVGPDLSYIEVSGNPAREGTGRNLPKS